MASENLLTAQKIEEQIQEMKVSDDAKKDEGSVPEHNKIGENDQGNKLQDQDSANITMTITKSMEIIKRDVVVDVVRKEEAENLKVESDPSEPLQEAVEATDENESGQVQDKPEEKVESSPAQALDSTTEEVIRKTVPKALTLPSSVSEISEEAIAENSHVEEIVEEKLKENAESSPVQILESKTEKVIRKEVTDGSAVLGFESENTELAIVENSHDEEIIEDKPKANMKSSTAQALESTTEAAIREKVPEALAVPSSVSEITKEAVAVKSHVEDIVSEVKEFFEYVAEGTIVPQVSDVTENTASWVTVKFVREASVDAGLPNAHLVIEVTGSLVNSHVKAEEEKQEQIEEVHGEVVGEKNVSSGIYEVGTDKNIENEECDKTSLCKTFRDIDDSFQLGRVSIDEGKCSELVKAEKDDKTKGHIHVVEDSSEHKKDELVNTFKDPSVTAVISGHLFEGDAESKAVMKKDSSTLAVNSVIELWKGEKGFGAAEMSEEKNKILGGDKIDLAETSKNHETCTMMAHSVEDGSLEGDSLSFIGTFKALDTSPEPAEASYDVQMAEANKNESSRNLDANTEVLKVSTDGEVSTDIIGKDGRFKDDTATIIDSFKILSAAIEETEFSPEGEKKGDSVEVNNAKEVEIQVTSLVPEIVKDGSLEGDKVSFIAAFKDLDSKTEPGEAFSGIQTVANNNETKDIYTITEVLNVSTEGKSHCNPDMVHNEGSFIDEMTTMTDQTENSNNLGAAIEVTKVTTEGEKKDDNIEGKKENTVEKPVTSEVTEMVKDKSAEGVDTSTEPAEALSGIQLAEENKNKSFKNIVTITELLEVSTEEETHGSSDMNDKNGSFKDEMTTNTESSKTLSVATEVTEASPEREKKDNDGEVKKANTVEKYETLKRKGKRLSFAEILNTSRDVPVEEKSINAAPTDELKTEGTKDCSKNLTRAIIGDDEAERDQVTSSEKFPTKTCQCQPINILPKLKNSILKVKKAIRKKSTSSETITTKGKN